MATLNSNLQAIAFQAPAAAESALLKTAADIVDLAKQLCPVDTGMLKQSIGADPVSSEVVRVGSDKKYAPFVEFGTWKSAAQAFLTPSFLQSEDTFRVRLQQEMQKLV